jgi:hypothetical protein
MKQIIVKKKKVQSIKNGVNFKETEIFQNKLNCFQFWWELTKVGLIIAFLTVCDHTEIFDENPE